MADEVSLSAFIKSKFDNLCLIGLIVFSISLLTWVDKHGNGDYEKWLEVFTAGLGGAYLGLITASRESWRKAVESNGMKAGAPAPASPSLSDIDGQR